MMAVAFGPRFAAPLLWTWGLGGLLDRRLLVFCLRLLGGSRRFGRLCIVRLSWVLLNHPPWFKIGQSTPALGWVDRAGALGRFGSSLFEGCDVCSQFVV